MEDLSLWEYTNASWAFVMIFVPLVVLFGVVSNVAFIFVVYRVKFMRNITNVYLVNLAIADSSLLLAGLVQYIGDYVVCPEYDLRFSFHTSFGCSVPNFLIYLCYYASLWTVTLVSLERYLAVCHTFWHRAISDYSRSVKMIASIWVISVFFASFAAPYTRITLCGVETENELGLSEIAFSAPFCEFTCGWCATALFLTDLIQFIITIIVNFVMYTLIVYHLGKTMFPISNDESAIQANIRAMRTRHTVAKMLIINGVLFFICLTPFSVANINSLTKSFGVSVFDEETIVLLSWGGRVLFMVNSAVNPLVYNASNPRYRDAFREAFGLQKPQGNGYSQQRTISTNTQVTKI